MPQSAHITSVDAIDAFRANVIVYVSKARPTLEEVSAEVVRTKIWLENQQRGYWESQVKQRTRDLQEAQEALFSARISNLRRETAAEQMAFTRAKRALRDAETKLSVVKRWARDFDQLADPLVKQMEKLHSVLANDLVKAVAFLDQVLSTLASYSEMRTAPLTTPAAGTPPEASSEPAKS